MTEMKSYYTDVFLQTINLSDERMSVVCVQHEGYISFFNTRSCETGQVADSFDTCD